MSRSYNKHNKSWNSHKREAKYYSNKNRRHYGKKFIDGLEKVDGDDNEMAVDVPKNHGRGDIWNYD